MKKLILLSISLICGLVLNGQQTFVITSSGFTFSPSSVNVSSGDIVRFNVGASHPVAQVSKSTWDANGTTALPGGFAFPTGIGDYTAGASGTYYYVCQDHVSLGMKGTITVGGVSGVNDSRVNDGISIFPNPAGNYVIFQSALVFSFSQIKIIDIMGRVVKVFQEPLIISEPVRLNIENLGSGIYFILFRSESGTIVKKFLKS